MYDRTGESQEQLKRRINLFHEGKNHNEIDEIFELEQRAIAKAQEQPQEEEAIETETEESELEEEDFSIKDIQEAMLRKKKKDILEKIEESLNKMDKPDYSKTPFEKLPLETQKEIYDLVQKLGKPIMAQLEAQKKAYEERWAKREKEKVEKVDKYIEESLNEIKSWSTNPIIQNRLKLFLEVLMDLSNEKPDIDYVIRLSKTPDPEDAKKFKVNMTLAKEQKF